LPDPLVALDRLSANKSLDPRHTGVQLSPHGQICLQVYDASCARSGHGDKRVEKSSACEKCTFHGKQHLEPLKW